MNKIRSWWKNVSARLAAEGNTLEDITGSELCRMLKHCPTCGDGFNNHDYAHIAVTVLGQDRRGRVREFLDACEDHLWEEAVTFQDFDARRDALVAYALRCHTGRIIVLLERSPSEAYESDRLIACDVLDEASGRELESLIAQPDWRRLNWT